MVVGGVAAGSAGIVGMTIGGVIIIGAGGEAGAGGAAGGGGACVIIIGAGGEAGADGAAGRVLDTSSAMLLGAIAELLFVLSVTLAGRGLSGELFWLRRSPAAGAILYSHIPQAKTESVISDFGSLEAKACVHSTSREQLSR